MVDIDATVRALIERWATRKEIFRELVAIEATAKMRAKRFEGGKKDQRYRAQDERAIIARVGRLTYFVHHSTAAFGATDADRLLYDLMEKCPD
jgi:hypothetical protein